MERVKIREVSVILTLVLFALGVYLLTLDMLQLMLGRWTATWYVGPVLILVSFILFVTVTFLLRQRAPRKFTSRELIITVGVLLLSTGLFWISAYYMLTGNVLQFMTERYDYFPHSLALIVAGFVIASIGLLRPITISDEKVRSDMGVMITGLALIHVGVVLSILWLPQTRSLPLFLTAIGPILTLIGVLVVSGNTLSRRGILQHWR
ncbi:MAG: hypothetical protein KAW84_02825 [Thermoplasmata archaeon]|nr:hypothetical protein [Thermoplasmata archaeon]